MHMFYYIAISLKLCIRRTVVTSAVPLYPTMADAPDDRFATAFIFPTRIAGAEGIVAACCTKSSNLLQRQHKRSDGSIEIVAPAWLLFECYFFVGMTLS